MPIPAAQSSRPPQRWRRLVAMTLLASLLGGCFKLGPDYVKPDTTLPDQWAAPHGTGEREDLVAWWQKLEDPLLSELVDAALRNNPDIRSAQAALRQARAQRDLAGANRLPTVTGGFTNSRSRSDGRSTQHFYDAGFDASWEPDVFGAQSRDLEAAGADLAASQADLHATQVSLAAEVARNYIEMRNAQIRLRIVRDNLATQSETLQIADWRQQAGLTTVLDVEQARTNVEQTRAAIPALETAQATAAHRLGVLLGEGPAALQERLAAITPLPALPDAVATGIPADTLRQRPDVQAAERRLAAETARIGSAEAERYPSFNLSGSFGWQSAALDRLGSAGTVASSLALGMLVTLFDGGRISNRIEIQNAVQEQALAAYEKSVLTALEDVENALVAYANNRQRQATLRDAATSARNAAALARQLYESGNADFQKVLDAERSRLDVEEALANAEALGVTALIQLYKALGGGWQDTAENAPVEPSESHPS